MNGAGAIIEILKASGMLKEEAGELVATFEERPEDIAPEDGSPAKTSEWKESVVSATVGEAPGASADGPAGTPPTLSIHVQVRCTADEIEDLAPRLKALLRDFSTILRRTPRGGQRVGRLPSPCVLHRCRTSRRACTRGRVRSSLQPSPRPQRLCGCRSPSRGQGAPPPSPGSRGGPRVPPRSDVAP